MKIYVVTDLEGVAGVVDENSTWPGRGGYETARRTLTQEVNACCRGLYSGGADEVIVLNGHGANRAYDIVFDEIEPPAEQIVGSPWDRYLPGLDESCDGLVQLGAHAMSGTPLAVLEHTMSSASWVSCRINGYEAGEQGIIGTYAGYFGVPVIMVTGDKAACEEAAASFPGVVAVETKRGFSRCSARIVPSRQVFARIEEAARQCVLDRRSWPSPITGPAPCTIEVEFARTSHADGFTLKPGISRTGPRTLAFTAADIAQAFSLMY